MKLQKMTDFVLNTLNPENFGSSDVRKVINYAKFLQQPLTLGMLVPCDEEGTILEEPKRWNDYLIAPESFDGNKEWYELYDYEIALEKVLFKGFVITYIGANIISVVNKMDVNIAFSKETLKSVINKDIEWLVEYELPLTEYALKQIGINDTSDTSK